MVLEPVPETKPAYYTHSSMTHLSANCIQESVVSPNDLTSDIVIKTEDYMEMVHTDNIISHMSKQKYMLAGWSKGHDRGLSQIKTKQGDT